MLHTFDNLFLCSGTGKLTDYQQVHMYKYFYCNHSDKILDISKSLRDKLVKFQKLIFVDKEKKFLNVA